MGVGVGSVQGTVTDSTNRNGIPPLQGVTVTVGSQPPVTTDANGNYQVDNVPAGTNAVTGTLTGYGPYSGTVNVVAGQSVEHNFSMSVIGAFKWSYTTGGEIHSSPAIGSDGMVYVGSIDNNLYAIYGSSPLASTSWPMFHCNLMHTGRY
jgi:outer membrane protein assembly factor BamB